MLFAPTFSVHKLNFSVEFCFSDEQLVEVKWIPASKFAVHSHQNFSAAHIFPNPLHFKRQSFAAYEDI